MRNFFRKTENRILLILLLSALFFITLFFYDLNRKIDLGDRTIIGSVEFKNNIVQRKLDDQVVWESLTKDSPITNKDTIRSDSLSDALIRLNDGTVINMDENSMFYLDISDDDPTLDLSSGNISIKKSKDSNDSFKIRSDDNIVSIQDGELNLNKSADGSFTLHVEKGDASITNNGKTQNIASGNLAEIDGNNVSVKKIPFQLKSPANNKIFTTEDPVARIDFSWKPIEKYKKLKLEISKRSDFSVIVKTLNYPAQTETVTLPLGSYYWRLHSEDAGMSPQYRFHLFKTSQVNGKLPEDHVVLTYVEKLPSVSFQWNEDPLAKDYVLEISDNEKFEKLSSRHTTKSNSIAVDNLQSGDYYWRVKSNPITEDLPEKKTPVKTFKIQKTDSFPPPKPLRPIGGNWGVEEFSKNGFFTWNHSHELLDFKIIVATDMEFKNVLFNSKTVKNFYQPARKLKLGEYYWKVQGIAASGKTSDFSKTERFELIPDDKVVKNKTMADNDEKSVDEDDTEELALQYPNNTVVDLSGESNLKFEWNQPGSKNSQKVFTLFRQESGSKKPVHQIKTKSDHYNLKNLDQLDEGKYSWEVSIKDKKGITKKKTGYFVITLAKLKGLEENDIEFISPEVIYKDE